MLPGVVLTGILVWRSFVNTRAISERRLLESARVDASALDREFDGAIGILQTLATSPALDRDDLAQFYLEARRVHDTQPGWYTILLLSNDLQPVVSSRAPWGMPLSWTAETSSLQRLIATRRPVVGVVRPAPGGPEQLFAIRVPILRQSAVKYALSAIVNVIACEDNGPGIPADLVSKMFDPFAQGPRDLDRREGGLGLGLALARTFTELHGGTIRVEPRDADGGSRFVVTLPRQRSSGDGDTPELVPRNVGSDSQRILLVDDNADAREMLRSALERAGHVVEIAGNGPEAIDLAGGFRPEIGVLDIGLPGMDGYELALRLRAMDPGIRLIALTGYGQAGDLKAAETAGFDAHCAKPVTITGLLDQIERGTALSHTQMEKPIVLDDHL